MKKISMLLFLVLSLGIVKPILGYPPNWIRLLRIEKPVVKSGSWVKLWASAGGYHGAETPQLFISSDKGETWKSLSIDPTSVVKKEVPGLEPQRFMEVSLRFRAPTQVGNYIIKATSKAPFFDEERIIFSVEDPSTPPHQLTLRTVDLANTPVPTYVRARIPLFGQSYICYYDGSLTTHVISTYAEQIDIEIYFPPDRKHDISQKVIISEDRSLVIKLPFFARATSPFMEYLDKVSLSQEISDTGVTAYIIDNHDNDSRLSPSRLSQCHTNPSFIRTHFNTTVATIENDGIYYLCHFAKIRSIKRLKGNQVNVDFRNGQSIIGNWIPNDRTSNFYRDSENPLETGYVYCFNVYYYGLAHDNPSRINIDYVKKVVFDEPEDQKPSDTQPAQMYPKRIELTDGNILTTDVGYVVDFCGHGWSSTNHLRLQDYCRTLSSDWRGIPLKDIAEIIFTGKFDDEHPQCREIILKYKDGKEQKESLFLTSESYSGVCNHSSRFRYFDKMFALQDYGAVLIPLDKVKKVIPI